MGGIHSTAIISPGATLGKDVSVGPYTIIEHDVVIGDHTSIGPHVVIRNHTHIGQCNRIYQFSSIGESPQHQGYANEPTRLVIGDRNVIREYTTLHRGTPEHPGATQIGNDNFFMAYSHIAHDCTVGNHVTFANGASLAGHVEVGDHAVMGGFSLVHQYCKVGAHCITGIGSVCLQDVPPFIKAAGNTAQPYGINIRGLSRRGFPEQTVVLLKRAYQLLYRSNLDLRSAIREIESLAPRDPAIVIFCDFLQRANRGIIRR